MKKETDIINNKADSKIQTIFVDNSKEEIRKYRYEKYKTKYESRIRTVNFGYWILIPMIMTAIYSSLPYARSLMSFLLNPVKDIVNLFDSRSGKLIAIALFLVLFAVIAYGLLLIIIKFIGLIDSENKSAIQDYIKNIDGLIENVKSDNTNAK